MSDLALRLWTRLHPGPMRVTQHAWLGALLALADERLIPDLALRLRTRFHPGRTLTAWHTLLAALLAMAHGAADV